MFARLKKWLIKMLAGAREAFILVARGVKDDVLAVLNDPELQALATAACRSAATKALTGDDAWHMAFGEFKAAARAKGVVLATNIAETLLQTAYTVWKANGKPEA